jgi:hypothetical protein
MSTPMLQCAGMKMGGRPSGDSQWSSAASRVMPGTGGRRRKVLREKNDRDRERESEGGQRVAQSIGRVCVCASVR